MNKAVFLDRDGVINIDSGYISQISDIRFYKGIYSILRYLQKHGFILIIVTNQSGIERGYFKKDDLNKIHRYMIYKLRKHGIKITSIFYSTSQDNENHYRKPNPGMLLLAKEKFNINMKNSILIGNKKSDIIAGKRAGIGCNILFQDNDIADYRISKLGYIKRIV